MEDTSSELNFFPHLLLNYHALEPLHSLRFVNIFYTPDCGSFYEIQLNLNESISQEQYDGKCSIMMELLHRHECIMAS